jgi:hypothetical protein
MREQWKLIECGREELDYQRGTLRLCCVYECCELLNVISIYCQTGVVRLRGNIDAYAIAASTPYLPAAAAFKI